MYYIWKVNYDTSFSSSSTDGGAYTKYDRDRGGFVITRGGSLDDVKKAIKDTLSNQQRLTSLNNAEFVGEAINTL